MKRLNKPRNFPRGIDPVEGIDTSAPLSINPEFIEGLIWFLHPRGKTMEHSGKVRDKTKNRLDCSKRHVSNNSTKELIRGNRTYLIRLPSNFQRKYAGLRFWPRGLSPAWWHENRSCKPLLPDELYYPAPKA